MESSATPKLTSVQFMKLVGGATRGIFLRTGSAVREMGAFILQEGLTGQVPRLEVGKHGLMISSADADVLDILAERAERITGAEVQRRLTLKDLAAEFRGCDSVEVIKAASRNHKHNLYDMLVVKSGYDVIVTVVIDHGIRKNARVLVINMVMAGKDLEVESYDLVQYETSIDGIKRQECQRFLVADYTEPESPGDKRTKFERCRDAVTEWKVTGGAGEKGWVEKRAKADKGDNPEAAADSLTKELGEMNWDPKSRHLK